MTDETMLDRLADVMDVARMGQGPAAGSRAYNVAMARVALAELRNPTPAMLDAGFQAMWTPDSVSAMWRAMIDAALRDGKA